MWRALRFDFWYCLHALVITNHRLQVPILLQSSFLVHTKKWLQTNYILNYYKTFIRNNTVYSLMKFLCPVINNWYDFALTITYVWSTACSVLFGVSVKKVQRWLASGRIRTHDLLLTSADILISRPPGLHDDSWPASKVKELRGEIEDISFNSLVSEYSPIFPAGK